MIDFNKPCKHPHFVFEGRYSREFLESMGYKEFIPPPIFNVVTDPIMPLEPIKLAYELNVLKEPEKRKDEN